LIEGLAKKDEAIVRKHTDEVAKREVARALLPFYKKLIEQAAAEAKHVDSFLLDLYRNREDLLVKFLGRDVLDEFIRVIRQGLSVFFTYKHWGQHQEEAIRNCTLSRIVVPSIKRFMENGYNKTFTWEDARTKTSQKLNALTNDTKYARRDIADTLVFSDLILHALQDFDNTIMKECKLYVEQHERFLKEEQTDRIVASIDKLLEYKHTEIQHEEILLLKTQFDEYPFWSKMTNEQYEPNFPDKVLRFKDDLESTAVQEYGFSPGMFVYSQTYFDILGKISPANPEKNKHGRSEL